MGTAQHWLDQQRAESMAQLVFAKIPNCTVGRVDSNERGFDFLLSLDSPPAHTVGVELKGMRCPPMRTVSHSKMLPDDASIGIFARLQMRINRKIMRQLLVAVRAGHSAGDMCFLHFCFYQAVSSRAGKRPKALGFGFIPDEQMKDIKQLIRDRHGPKITPPSAFEGFNSNCEFIRSILPATRFSASEIRQPV
jgi:hypothetical protein